jgi:FkbM family methyltransferase
MPARFGGDPIMVSPEALLKLWWPNLELADKCLFAWASECIKKDDVVWDVGANVGLFSFAAASLAGPNGHVVAIEADIWLAQLLRRSAQRRSSQRAAVEVLPAAIGASVDIAKFNIAARSRAANYLDCAEGSTQAGGVRETQSVMAVTLDWLLERRQGPNVLKIDVEGAEDLVLKGATRLLSDARPTILCEVRDTKAQIVSDILHSFGYKLFDLNAPRARQPIQLATYNTLACPNGMLN